MSAPDEPTVTIEVEVTLRYRYDVDESTLVDAWGSADPAKVARAEAALIAGEGDYLLMSLGTHGVDDDKCVVTVTMPDGTQGRSAS